MLDNKRENNLSILIIDDCREYSNALSAKFKHLRYKVLQSFDLVTANKYIDNYKDKLNLVILSIDIPNLVIAKTIKELEDKTDAKLILVSNNEDSKKRESYFQNGILDYHLKSNSIDYIVSDIDILLNRLVQNKKENVLIIDDSRVVRYVIQSLLEVRNYNILTAQNAKEGIDIIENNDISLLILDMELPDMHGIEVLNRLRDLYFINNFPTLVLSGSINPSIVRDALKKGASDFLKKPFLYEEFLLKIDLWIKSSKWQREFKGQKVQIENSLKSFEVLVNSTIEALFIFEKNICIDINKEALNLLGEENRVNILGQEISEIFYDFTKKHKDELLDNTTDHYFEDIFRNSVNKKYQLQIKEKNMQIGDKVLKIIAVMDITQIKQKEHILSNQSKMASMGEMIGNIAHQWRQPLTAISVAAGGIKLNYELDMVDEKETLEELDNIVNNTQFLSDTIEDFQNYLKDNRDAIVFSIKDTIDKTISIINANLNSYEINIVKDYNQNIQIEGIQNDLIQVFLNIINNASDILKTIKNSDKEKYIVITLDQNDSDIKIMIQDSAGGVPDKIIDKIFEPYFTTKHQSQGTGLGLYMTHQIINNMHGVINVTNNEFIYKDEKFYGAKFEIILPKTR